MSNPAPVRRSQLGHPRVQRGAAPAPDARASARPPLGAADELRDPGRRRRLARQDVRGRRGGGRADPEHRPRAPAAQPREGRRRPARHARRARADPRHVGRRLLDAARGAASPARADRGRASGDRDRVALRRGCEDGEAAEVPRHVEPPVQQGHPALSRPARARHAVRIQGVHGGRRAEPVRQRDDRRLGVRSRDPRARPPSRLRDRGGRRRVEGRRALARQSVHRLLEGDSRGADDPPQPRPRRLRALPQ